MAGWAERKHITLLTQSVSPLFHPLSIRFHSSLFTSFLFFLFLFSPPSCRLPAILSSNCSPSSLSLHLYLFSLPFSFPVCLSLSYLEIMLFYPSLCPPSKTSLSLSLSRAACPYVCLPPSLVVSLAVSLYPLILRFSLNHSLFPSVSSMLILIGWIGRAVPLQ